MPYQIVSDHDGVEMRPTQEDHHGPAFDESGISVFNLQHCNHQSFSYTCKTLNQTSVAYWPFSPHNVKITIIEHGLITVIK